ncbi:MAG: TetR/AcrR family transcriptional regulator [Candidatus Eiseniibacteriota bacterium]
MSDKSARKTIVAKEVLEQAALLFASKGFAATSLQDVAEAIGLSRPALYYYFPSKNALLAAMVEDVTVAAVTMLAEIRNNVELGPEERLRRAVESLVLWSLERPNRFKVIDRAEELLPPDISATHEAAKRQVLQAMSTLIADGVAAGILRPVEPRMAALSIIGMCNWTAWWWTPKSRHPKEEVATFIGEMAIAALRRVGPNQPSGNRLEDAIELLRSDLDYLEVVARAGADAGKAAKKPVGTAKKREPRG